MGIRDTFRGMFGGGERAADSIPVDAPSVEELLAPNRVMEKEWHRAAREDALQYGDMTRAELGREFGARWFTKPLPAAGDERRVALEERLVARSRSLYADHVERVHNVYDLPDQEIQTSVMSEMGPVPPRSRPLERALHISGAMLEDEIADRDMDLRAREREEDHRMNPPSWNDWAEHRAGEPSILAAERDGDDEHVDYRRRAYLDSFQLKDPTLREIAMTVVDKADRWSTVDADELSSGQVRLDPRTADKVRSSAATYEPGQRRDSVLAEAYLGDYAARHPKVVEQWNRQALEVMSEGPAFMRARYGGIDTDGMAVRQVVSLEVMRSVSAVRAAQAAELERAAAARVRPVGRSASAPLSSQMRAASMSAMAIGRSMA